MASAAWELQKAIHAALVADGAVTGLLGGARVWDDVPRGADFPYVTFAGSAARDWSTASDAGSEHFLSLNVWSRSAGEREVHEVMGAVRDALHDAALSVPGYRLVNLRHESSDATRESDGETYRGTMRFRAVLEAMP